MKTPRTSKAFPSLLTSLITLIVLIGHDSACAQGDKSKEAAKAAAAKLPPAKEVIAKFVTAIGGKEAYAKINSQYAKGKFEMAAQGIGGNLEVFAKRPNKLLIKINIAAMGDILRGFDGQVGWSTDAAMGPALTKGKELDQTREQADFDHVLHNEKDFKSMETVEITQFEGKECYKLKLVTQSDSEMTEYYDTKTGLLVGTIATQESALGPLVVTSISSDYKKFGDVLFATKVVQKMGPLEQTMTISSFEFNKVADSVFDPPAPIKALIKK
jgi:zinc protease